MALPAAAALCITGTLIVLATASQDEHLQVGLFPPCSATLSPQGPCELEGDGCPFVFNLPPMTVNLPKQLVDLERLVEELQMLKDNVDELRRICKDCAVSQSEKECTRARAEEDAHTLDNNTHNGENNKRIVDEKTEKERNSLAKENVEQVVAAGQNGRISERKKLDWKQTERNGMVKGAADKQNSSLSNASPLQNTTYGKKDPQLWQMMDSKRQTKAADEREDGGVKPGESGGQELHDKSISYGKDISGKRYHQMQHEGHMVNNKDARAQSRGRDTGSRQDKHHKASHEERQEKTFGNIEKTTKQPIAIDRPVWRDKALVDMNQMETDRGSEERPEKNSHGNNGGKKTPTSSQSGRDVWPDETMERSKAKRIQPSETNGGTNNYFWQDPNKMSQNNRDAKDLQRDIKDEKMRGERFRHSENINLMEATDLPSGSQASVVNSAQSHGFIGLDQAVTLTSPPSFTTLHLTTAVKEGQQRQMNGKGGIKEQLGLDVRLARGHEKWEDGGETNIGQLKIPVLESSDKKVDMSRRHKPTNTEADTSSTFEFSTDLYQGKQNVIQPPTQSNVSTKSTTFEHTHLNATFAKRAEQPTTPASKINSTTNTERLFRRIVSQGEEKTAHRLPSKTGHLINVHAKISGPISPSSTASIKDSETMSSEFDQSNISKDVTVSPITSNSHFTSEVKKDHKTTFGQSSQNNRDATGSSTKPENIDDVTEISSTELKPDTVIVSDPTHSPTDSKSHASQDFKQEHGEASKEPTSLNFNKMGSKKEDSRPKIQFYQLTDVHATTSTATGPKPKDTVHRDKNESYNVSQNNQDEKPSSATHANADTQSSKTTVLLITGALEGTATSSTTKSSNSQISKDVKHHHLQTNYKEASQGNHEEKSHSAGYPSQYLHPAKANAKNETISSPRVSDSHVLTRLNKGDTNMLKAPPSESKHTEHEHSVLNARLAEGSRAHAMDKDATTLDTMLSSLYNTTHYEKTHREMATTTPTRSDANKKNLEKDPLRFDALNKLTIEPTGSASAEDSTISTPTYDRHSNNGDRKPLQKTLHGQATDYNGKDEINDLEKVRDRSQPTSGLVGDITSSAPALRQDASFNDAIMSPTFTSHQMPPTTPSVTHNNMKINSSKTIPYQRPKPSIGMKPEAEPKVKNPKNDRKLERSPPPDSRVKNDHRQKHPKVTPGKAPWPVQIPKKPHQSTKANEPDDNVFPLKPSPSAQRPKPAPSLTGLHLDETHKPNATSAHEGTQGTHEKNQQSDKANGGLRKENDPESRHFIQKAGNMQHSTGNVTLTLDRSSEFNGTTQRTYEGIRKSPKVDFKVPKVDQKAKLQAPKVKSVHPKLEADQKEKLQQTPKAKIPKVSKITALRNGTQLLPGSKQTNKPVKPKTIPSTKIKVPPKAKDSPSETDVRPTPDPKSEHGLKAASSRQNVTDLQTINPNSTVLSNAFHPTLLVALTTKPNKVLSAPASTNNELNQGENSPSSQAPQLQLRPTTHTVFRLTAFPAPDHGPKVPAVESTTPSSRELRVKINQVAAFPNKSSQQHPPGRPLGAGPREPSDDGTKTERKTDIQAVRDCSDHMLKGHTHSGLYLVTPDPSGGTVPVLCDMAVEGGGWTVLQRRQDGSVSFNRSWAEYREGFGQLQGEFWLGNHLLHLLTRDRGMELRVELEDFEGVRGHAHYQLFKVASERMRYRLSVDGYTGTAGDALRFSTQYDHNNRAFTTPDRDNDRYPSGNCGAYYSSGWWFDACMAANLNGRYYSGRYKGVRDGIYWGTWHNISTEYYPTNERLAFKTVSMMTRPRGFKPSISSGRG